MKPVQLYIVIALIFFLLFKGWDIFYNRLQYMIVERALPGNEVVAWQDNELGRYQRWMKRIVTAKAARHNTTAEEEVKRIDAALPDRSKAFAFLLIPFIALGIYAVGAGRYDYYAIHLVHATHLLSFLFACTVLWAGGYQLIARLANLQPNYSYVFIPIHLLFIVYLFESLRKVLRPRRAVYNFVNVLVVSAFYLLAVILYRNGITLFSALLA